MLNKLFIILAIIVMPVLASAADIAPAKIAIVDINRVMSNSNAIKQANTELQNKRDQYQKQITSEEESLKKGEEDLAKQRGVLSKEDLNEKQKQFIDQVNKVRKDVQLRKGKLDKAYRDALIAVQVAVRDIVTAMAMEKGFDIALPSEPLIFAHKDIDITEEVIKRLNDKLPKIVLKFE